MSSETGSAAAAGGGEASGGTLPAGAGGLGGASHATEAEPRSTLALAAGGDPDGAVAGPDPATAALVAFRPFFQALLGHEGGLTTEAADPGNWSGGAVGKGSLRGTRYGISAAAYPDEDIAALTTERAEALYFRDYWCRTGCDALPPLLRDLVFDSAVNNGPGNAARFLQRALGVADDGRIGPITRAAIAAADPVTLGEAFQRERASFHTKLSTWSSFGKGWAIRLATVPFQAMRLAGIGPGQG